MMLDTKKAYETLGLEENATDEEVEQRYLILVKRLRHASSDDAAGVTMEAVTEAYNFIKNEKKEQLVRQMAPASKTAERFGHIWEYYRFHIIGSILAIILIVYTVSGILDNKREQKLADRQDVRITFFAGFHAEETGPLKDKLLAHFPEWKTAGITGQYAPLDPKDQFEVAMQQKAFLSIAYDKTDVYIMDAANFERYGKEGVYLKLDGLPGLSGSIPDGKRRLLRKDDDPAPVWYGVDITDGAALKDLNLPAGDKIAAVRYDAKNKDNALKALEWLAKK